MVRIRQFKLVHGLLGQSNMQHALYTQCQDQPGRNIIYQEQLRSYCPNLYTVPLSLFIFSLQNFIIRGAELCGSINIPAQSLLKLNENCLLFPVQGYCTPWEQILSEIEFEFLSCSVCFCSKLLGMGFQLLCMFCLRIFDAAQEAVYRFDNYHAVVRQSPGSHLAVKVWVF